MGRLHLVETEDLPWFPGMLRDFETDLLQFTFSTLPVYDPVVPMLRRLFDHTSTVHATDLCSGGGGPWVRLLPQLQAALGRTVSVTLTDLYPNVPALTRCAERSAGTITSRLEPLDATAVGERGGVRTLFSSFHHFPPERARSILRDARDAGAAIGVFEFTSRTVYAMTAMLAAPAWVVGATPFIRPYRISRFLCSWLVPVVPVLAAWNGVVSCLRTYSPRELHELTADLARDDYRYEIGVTPARLTGPPITWLLGIPG